MTRGRSLSAAAAVSMLGLVILVAYLYRYTLLNLAAMLMVGRVGWHVLHAKLGIRRRPKSSWSSLGRTAALMFGAWNTRWLKPHQAKASVPAKAGVEHSPADFGEVPY